MTLTAPPRLLLVHAHPDDETLVTGGTIAHYAARGAQVTLVTCTLGEEGEVIPEELRGLAADRADQLGGYRIGELGAACSALGVAEHRFLGGLGCWRDSGMRWAGPGQATALPNDHPRAFATGDFAEQVAQLTDVLREVRPDVVVTYADDGGYGHPDHVRAHHVTTAAATHVPEVRRVFHTAVARRELADGLAALDDVRGLPFDVPAVDDTAHVADERITSTMDISAHIPAKLAALRAHRTQVQVYSQLWDENSGPAVYALSNDVAQPVLGAEHYVLASGDAAGCAADLFGGLDMTSDSVHGRERSVR